MCDLQSMRKQKKNSSKIECLEATKRRKTIGRGINKKKITITEEEEEEDVNNYQEIHHRMYLKFIIKNNQTSNNHLTPTNQTNQHTHTHNKFRLDIRKTEGE